MAFDPTNWRTWERLEDHPIFHSNKRDIAEWSHDSSQYSELENYSRFMPDSYAHVLPPPATEIQSETALKDVQILAESCNQILDLNGPADHELVILDDFTVFVWIKNDELSLNIYPMQMFREPYFKLLLHVEAPFELDELQFATVEEMVHEIVSRYDG